MSNSAEIEHRCKQAINQIMTKLSCFPPTRTQFLKSIEIYYSQTMMHYTPLMKEKFDSMTDENLLRHYESIYYMAVQADAAQYSIVGSWGTLTVEMIDVL
jgi:hypothetical protein